ncbi:MAG TPA: DUF3293 domain-containing protein [Myxococcaceae bacterium]|nr:DUF3293 domain-containing protein [Myxococcaceae bacterium]
MVDPKLVQAYLETRYRVFPPGSPEHVLRVGQRHPGFDAQLAEARGSRWVVLTAWNPGSVRCTEAENTAAQGELGATLRRAGLVAWPARGESPGRDWMEESLCVLDLDPEQARALARRFGQVAVVQGELGGEARLVFSD